MRTDVRSSGAHAPNPSGAFLALDFLLALFIINLTVQPPVEPDFGWHLRAGMDFWERGGTLPTRDPYSHTMPDWPWVEHAWLTDAVIAFLYRGLGSAGLLGVMVFFAGSAAAAFVIGVAGTPAARTARLVAVAGSLWVALPFLGARTQLISLLGVALLVWLYRRILQGYTILIWAYPPLFCLWANLHGGFTAGLFLLGILVAGLGLLLVVDRWWSIRAVEKDKLLPARRLGQLSLSWVLSIAATFMNPYGWRLHREIFDSLTDRFMIEHLQEWQPLSFSGWAGTAFVFYVLILAGMMSIWYRRVDPLQWMLMAISLAWSVMHWRNVTIFLVIAVPVVAEVIQAGLQRTAARMPGSGRQAAGLGLVGLAAAWLWYLGGDHLKHIAQAGLDPARFFETTEYPIEAVRWVREHRYEVGRRMYNEYGHGGFLLWWLPDEPIFIDGRMPAWRSGDRAIFPDYLTAQAGGAEGAAVLDTYRVDWGIMYRNSALAASLAERPGWYELYRDAKVVILRRRL